MLQLPFDTHVPPQLPPVHAFPQLSVHAALQVPSGEHVGSQLSPPLPAASDLARLKDLGIDL